MEVAGVDRGELAEWDEVGGVVEVVQFGVGEIDSAVFFVEGGGVGVVQSDGGDGLFAAHFGGEEYLL